MLARHTAKAAPQGVAGLAASLREALVLDSWQIPEVCRCAVASAYSFPDPDSRMARYQLDVEMVTRP